jgi:hypothetical protein
METFNMSNVIGLKNFMESGMRQNNCSRIGSSSSNFIGVF